GLGGDAEVAGAGERDPRTGARPVDRGDDRLLERADRKDVRVVRRTEHVPGRAGVLAELVQVLPDAETAACASDHDGANLGIARLLESVRDALVHLKVDRIEHVGAIERDRQHAAVPRDLHLGHASEPTSPPWSPRGLRPLPPDLSVAAKLALV